MCGDRFYPALSDQCIKKKSLRASESPVLLKIEGYNGKFQTVTDVSGNPPASVGSLATASDAKEEVKIRPSASFRLKEAFAETTARPATQETSPKENVVRIEARDAFDKQKIQQILEEYIREHKPETTVSVALTSHQPVLKGENIILEVDNKLQLEKLEDLKPLLQHLLMNKLNNGFITVSFRYFDDKSGKEQKKPITAQDKLAHFMKLNPVVSEMKKMFGLELE